MSLYSALCEISGSLSSNGGASANGNGKSPSSSSKPGYVYDEYSRSWVYASPVKTVKTVGADVLPTGPYSDVKDYPISYGQVPLPFNAGATGIPAAASSQADAVSEVQRQLPPSYTYEGPLGGAGPFGLLAPKVGSDKYEDYIATQITKEKENYNPKTLGIAPLAKNDRTAISEVVKQTEGPSLWEKFSTGVEEGYTREPEDVNVFEKSVSDAGKALTGVIDPSNYYLLAIAGGVLLLILIIK